MKAKHIPTSLILLMLTLSGILGIATAADAQEVHALLIILGNDSNIRESVEKNEEKITNMLKQLSYRCNVHLTLMYSKSERDGSIISEKKYVKGRSEESAKAAPPDIIKSQQVVEWLENLKPKSEDTVFIYYNGHGEIDSFNTHLLIFDPGVRSDTPDRGKLSEKLKQKPARLRMLITDTCSSPSEDLSDDTFAKFSVGVRSRARSYLQNLFLEHEGFLDITAASPGQFAIGNSDLGGHFTSALLSQGFTAAAMTGKDDFLSWQEAFDETKTQTNELYGKAVFGPEMQRDLQKNKQNTQEPYAHSLPTRIGGSGGGSAPPQRPDTIASTAILNFTSVPSGAKVEIDGFVVGKTPLNGYELETDGKRTKEIEVTIKAAGYTDAVEKFRVPRGKPFNWNFELTKKVPEMPQIDGAEMVLIPAGEFQMGSNDGDSNEKPVHTVYIDAFYMDTYEVTNAQFKKFVDANPQWQKDRIEDRFREGFYLSYWNGNNYPSGKADYPVICVSWYAAMAYAEWAGKRLPTEAEWEKAARGGLKGQKYPWGNTINANQANYDVDAFDASVGIYTTSVGSYAPNGYGLHDMAGNAWEWCIDAYNRGFYPESSARNPISGGSITSITDNYTQIKSYRVLRGGAWSTNAFYVRCARRSHSAPTDTGSTVGFRCVRAVTP